MQTSTDMALAGLAFMAGGFLMIAGLELLLPFRRRTQSPLTRWTTNLALFAIDTLAVRFLLPIAMVGTAVFAAQEGWGLSNVLSVPGWLAFSVTLLVLDLALYLQHWATHRVPLLWRLHRVHHTDRDFDVTTAARFHPIEILASMVWKCGIVLALGAPMQAVFVFEVGFALFTLWTHANLSLPAGLDRVARKLIVTPDMHRIHHSSRERETNSNYGTVLSGWDKLFGTYRAESQDGQSGITIGLVEWQDDRTASLGFSLLLPFRKR
ncbi:sterol desaturase family protein [Aurantiacibacter aquimixticola]|uniref:Sterol desaturase family protein n=1 Tax=Aurantiacibacter aquimixticola TaxID=1958945 RepID=A0A419RU33_9SPHN|nr:sterol desaturase family protein [Aurantiacibacter aquimixticola]RJY09298.1 sterol desaturase family protein [Aurantiacibacter aquimixticola]